MVCWTTYRPGGWKGGSRDRPGGTDCAAPSFGEPVRIAMPGVERNLMDSRPASPPDDLAQVPRSYACSLASCSAEPLRGSGHGTAHEVWEDQRAMDGSHILMGCGVCMGLRSPHSSLSLNAQRGSRRRTGLARSHLTRPLVTH